MHDIYLCFKNLENMDSVDLVNKSHFLNTLTDTLFNISYQLSSTFSSTDKEDYIKSFFSDEINKQTLSSNIMGDSLFTEWLIEELNRKYIDFFGFDISSKIIEFNDLSIDEKFVKIYYNIYQNIALNQSFIIKCFYNIFSHLTLKQIDTIQNVLKRKINKNENKPIYKKYKLKPNNYILELNQILQSSDDVSKLILNTNIFDNLQNTIYYNDEVSKNYLYEIFIKNASKYEIESLFKNLFKFDINLDICINNIEVYAINNNFVLQQYGE